MQCTIFSLLLIESSQSHHFYLRLAFCNSHYTPCRSFASSGELQLYIYLKAVSQHQLVFPSTRSYSPPKVRNSSQTPFIFRISFSKSSELSIPQTSSLKNLLLFSAILLFYLVQNFIHTRFLSLSFATKDFWRVEVSKSHSVDCVNIS